MSVDQKYRAQKLQREIAACRRLLASKPSPKPLVKIPVQPVGFNRPDFGELAFARMDRQRSILQEVRTTPKAFVSAKDAVREMVDMLMKTQGVDRRRAMSQIAKDRPDLLDAMKSEANPHLAKTWRNR